MKKKDIWIKEIAKKAKEAFIKNSALDNSTKNKILLEISQKIKNNKDEIQKSNQKDLDLALKLVKDGDLSEALYNRLVLKDEKIDLLSNYLEEVAGLEDPVNKKQFAMRLDDGLDLVRISCPIGVIAVIFESRPEVVIQVSALSLKSGNSVILKGGREAYHTNWILFKLINEVLLENDLSGAVNLIETREDVALMLDQDELIDLIIPRGSNQFVQYIQNNTKIPVLGHSSGICHIFIDQSYDVKKAIDIIIDSKTDYPSACNAVETLLVHKEIAKEFFPTLLKKLEEEKIKIAGCQKSKKLATEIGYKLKGASEDDFYTEYSDLGLSIKIVESLNEATKHINTFGSHHTDAIITEDDKCAKVFFQKVDSSCVFHNASTRFSDGYVFGLGAEVGISTNKTHSRGPVGLEGMMIYKYVLMGDGHIKAMYSGKNPKPYKHQKLEFDKIKFI